MKISIVIPVYNSENKIKKCLNSIINQSYKDFEIIIVNDGSTDGTINICNKYKEFDNRIFIINQKNMGVGKARKVGITKSTGDYITFVDADDWLSRNSLEIMVSEINRTNSDIIQFAHTNVYKWLRVKKEIADITINYHELKENYIIDLLGGCNRTIKPSVWAKVYRTSIIKNAVLNIKEDLRIGEDIYLNLLAFTNKNVHKISLLNKSVYYYKVGVGLMSNLPLNYLNEYNKLKKIQYKFIIENKLNDEIMFQCQVETVYLIKYACVNIVKNINDKKECIQNISDCFKYDFVKIALDYFNNTKKSIWEDIEYFISEDVNKYYLYIINCLKEEKKNKNIKKIVRNLI